MANLTTGEKLLTATAIVFLIGIVTSQVVVVLHICGAL